MLLKYLLPVVFILTYEFSHPLKRHAMRSADDVLALFVPMIQCAKQGKRPAISALSFLLLLILRCLQLKTSNNVSPILTAARPT